ncbi:hypothetical protein JHK85_016052 [Glycine max]|nr:hypothetical protein JHK85_016052 [Glycine max]
MALTYVKIQRIAKILEKAPENKSQCAALESNYIRQSMLYKELEQRLSIHQFLRNIDPTCNNSIHKTRSSPTNSPSNAASLYKMKRVFVGFAARSNNSSWGIKHLGFSSDKIETFRACCGKGEPYNLSLQIYCGSPAATVCPDPSKHIN